VFFVMPGLDPGIHDFVRGNVLVAKNVDGPDKPGHDAGMKTWKTVP
jgi:hypothetical protein